MVRGFRGPTFQGDVHGVIAVETALVFTFLLVPLFLGGADVAILMKTEFQLESAIRNAVFFAYSSPSNALDSAGVVSAAEAAYGSGPDLVVATPTYAYYCITAAGTEASGTSVPSETSACPEGEFVATWMSVSVTADVTLPVSIRPFTTSVPLGASATVRVE